jgi:hypothetical protein
MKVECRRKLAKKNKVIDTGLALLDLMMAMAGMGEERVIVVENVLV